MAIGEFRTDYSQPGACPRCGGPLPIGYPGALSRADGESEICSTCGTEEAVADFEGAPWGAKANPATDWPVHSEPHVMTTPLDGSRRFIQ